MGRVAKKDVLEVTTEEIADLRREVESSDLAPRSKVILLTLIEEIVRIKKTKQEKQAELARIRRVLKNASEKRSSGIDSDKKADKSPQKNHGRNGADDYRPSKVVPHFHKDIKVGQKCPDCDHGTLQNLRPGKIIRLIGKTPIEAELHEPARLRCGGCGKVFTAELPPEKPMPQQMPL